MKKLYPEIQQNVGNRIRELREKRNHTQESLALKSGLDRTYINSVENGRRNISVQALDKIIIALNYTFKSLNSSTCSQALAARVWPLRKEAASVYFPLSRIRSHNRLSAKSF